MHRVVPLQEWNHSEWLSKGENKTGLWEQNSEGGRFKFTCDSNNCGWVREAFSGTVLLITLKNMTQGPVWAAQSVSMSTQHAKVAGSTLDQGTYRNQAMNA